MKWWKMVVAAACVTGVGMPAVAAMDCGVLKGLAVPATAIGLPTKGAVVIHAKEKSGACDVRGEILPVDAAADPIRFALAMPARWNGKAAQFGGGAFDGYVPDVTKQPVLGDKAAKTPLQQGYAVFASDSGHHHHYLLLPDRYNALSATFALNDEERKNFASEQIKKTHDAAFAVMQQFYGRRPARMYFLGGSTGGREAMMAVDKFPADYDGVLAAYAAWNQIESDLQFIRVSRALYAKGPDGQKGWLPSSKTKLLRDAVLRTCDATDGLSDGIVSNPAACRVDVQALRCADGRDHYGCLSDGQLRTVAAFSTPQVSTFAVRNGMSMEPGYNVLRGADLTGSLGFFGHAEANPKIILNSFYYLVADGVLRYFLTKDAHYDALGFDPAAGADARKNWVEGIRQQSEEDDSSDGDVSAFASHGGKLLLVHGTADTTIPTDASVLLYQRITAATPHAEDFVRLYLVPGFGHGRGVFAAGFDAIGTLDAWADRKAAPEHLVVADQHGGRTRPLCAWPSWPRYTDGDANAATSFNCAGSQ